MIVISLVTSCKILIHSYTDDDINDNVVIMVYYKVLSPAAKF